MINIELKGGGERIVRSLRMIYISCVKAVNMDISIFLLILQLYYVICEDEIPDHHFVKKLQDGKNCNSSWTKRTYYSEKSVYHFARRRL